MLQHEFVVGKSLAASQHWTLQLLLGCQFIACISLDGSPDDESMKSAVVTRGVASPVCQ